MTTTEEPTEVECLAVFLCLIKLQKIYSKAQMKRTPVPPERELGDSEEEDGETPDI